MDSALEEQFNTLQGALDKLRVSVEAKEDEKRSEAAERALRRQGSYGPCHKQSQPFYICSITMTPFMGSGPWLVKWIETDGTTNRRWEREFDNKAEAHVFLGQLRLRRAREQQS